MQDYLTLGPTPAEESCEQLGSDYDPSKARIECMRYRAGLEKLFPPPDGARLAIKSFPHDFGNYSEVCAVYDVNSQAATEWAFHVEGHCPGTWEELEGHAAPTLP